MNTERLAYADLVDFIHGLIYNGHGQINMLFDCRTGEWEVSWPSHKPKETSDGGESGVDEQ